MKIHFVSLILILFLVSESTARKSILKKHKNASFIRTAGDLLNFCMYEFRSCIFEQECLEQLDNCGLFRLRDKFHGYDQSQLLQCFKSENNDKITGLVTCIEETQKSSIDEPRRYNYSDQSQSFSDIQSSNNNQKPIPKGGNNIQTLITSQKQQKIPFIVSNTETQNRLQNTIRMNKN